MITLVRLEQDNCRTGCLFEFPCFKKYCKLIATDLGKQQNYNNSENI